MAYFQYVALEIFSIYRFVAHLVSVCVDCVDGIAQKFCNFSRFGNAQPHQRIYSKFRGKRVGRGGDLLVRAQ